MGRIRVSLSFLALALAAAVPQARAAVTVYTSLAAFQAAAPLATLATDFESKATGATGNFTLGGLSFSSPLGNMFVIGPTAIGTTNPVPPSHMLSANGQEDIFVALPSPYTIGLGFTILTNRFGAHTVRLYDPSNTVFFTYLTTQPNNTIGFVGFVSTTPISQIRWTANNGQNENTALDNFYVDFQTTPTRPTSWGRIKALYH